VGAATRSGFGIVEEFGEALGLPLVEDRVHREHSPSQVPYVHRGLRPTSGRTGFN
jgi:hypothetical protein